MTTSHENRQFEEKDEMSFEKRMIITLSIVKICHKSLVLSDNRALHGKTRPGLFENGLKQIGFFGISFSFVSLLMFKKLIFFYVENGEKISTSYLNDREGNFCESEGTFPIMPSCRSRHWLISRGKHYHRICDMKNTLKSEMRVGWVFQLPITRYHATKQPLR